MARLAYSWLLALWSVATVAALQNPHVVEGAYIVEYEDGVDLDAELASVEDVAHTRMKLDFSLFKGASIRFHQTANASDQAAELLNKAPAIKNMWPLTLYHVPAYKVDWVAGDDALADNAHGEAAAAARKAAADTFSPHVMTQVNKLRDEGIVGDGIKVAIVDTGIDYKHPALGGCFGPGCLVSFGHDLVGDDYTGANTGVPDDDPMDCQGHGTHVAGIVAAQPNNPYGIIGAATGVELGAYRVFGCHSAAANDVLIAAFNMAYEAGADLITASIGSPSGWSEAPWAVAVSRIVEKGVPCTLSAGNEGDRGLMYASAAANGHKITAVASVDNSMAPALLTNATYTVTTSTNNNTSTSSAEPIGFGYTPGEPAAWANVTLPLWAVNFNTSDVANACEPLPDDDASIPANLSDYVVLIRRGTCMFSQKLENVAARGARYALFYNNVPAGASAVTDIDVPGIEAIGMVEASQGAAWIEALAAGETVTLSMTDPKTAFRYLTVSENTLTGGYLSTFTTWGPTYELGLKPQLSAPGGLILSTFPTANGSYAVMSGTSMACPLVAGIFALLMQARGTKDPSTLENLLSATANPNVFHDGTTAYGQLLAPTAQQGAGLVQAYDAAHATTLLSTSSLAFNDTDHFVAEANFTLANTGNASVVYRLHHVGAATAMTLPPAEDGDQYAAMFPAAFPNELYDDYASLSFDADTVTIAAGQSATVVVAATPPVGLDPARLPVYSGYIAINGSDGSSLSLPYLGVAGSMKAATVLAANGTYLSSSKVGNQSSLSNTTTDNTIPPPAIPAGRTFFLPPPIDTNTTIETTIESITNSTTSPFDLPQLLFSLALGTALLRIDVVPLDTTVPYPPNNTAAVSPSLTTNTTIGDVWDSPIEYMTRNAAALPYALTWTGRLASGAYAPEGSYKLAVRALRIFGDRTVPDDYDLVETVAFSIRYANATTGATVLQRRHDARLHA